MSDVEIERCTPSEWKRFRDLRLRALGDSPSAFWHSYEEESKCDENTWRERLGGPGRAAFIATRGGGDAGLVYVGPPSWDPEADPAHYDIGGLWVAPHARGDGIASALLRAALAHAASQQATAATLWVIGDNDTALRVYQAAGFEATGREAELPEPRSGTEREMIHRL